MTYSTIEYKNNLINVFYTDSITQAEDYLKNNLRILNEDEEESVYIGFDIEWRPTIHPGQYNKTAVLQLAISDNKVLILQLRSKQLKIKNDEITSSTLVNKILTDPRYLKCGVGVSDDCKKLKMDLDNLYISSFLCVDKLAKEVYESKFHLRFGKDLHNTLQENFNFLKHLESVEFTDNLELDELVINIDILNNYLTHVKKDEGNGIYILLPYPQLPKCSLKYLSKYYLDFDLLKSKRVIMSNWESYPLSEAQIKYAALDAIIGLYLAKLLINEQTTTSNIRNSIIR